MNLIFNCNVIGVIPNYNRFYQDFFYRTNLLPNKVQEIINISQVCSLIRSKSNELILWFGYEDY